MRVKKMVVSKMKLALTALVFSLASTTFANTEGSLKAQMVNLNLHIKSKNTNSKSSLAMPFYQTAELERKIDNKNVLIELNPKLGKKAGEVAIDLKFYKASGSKAFYKKEIIAKLNQESKISYRGTTLRVTPVLN